MPSDILSHVRAIIFREWVRSHPLEARMAFSSLRGQLAVPPGLTAALNMAYRPYRVFDGPNCAGLMWWGPCRCFWLERQFAPKTKGPSLRGLRRRPRRLCTGVLRWREKSRKDFMLRRFDAGSVPPCALTLVLGPAKSGKTSVCRDLLRHKAHLPPGCDARALRCFMREQKACPTSRAYVVVDTITCLNDSALREAWVNGRCMGLFCVFTLQTPTYIEPGLRSNIDFLVLTREEDVGVMRSIWKMFPYGVDTFEQFRDAMLLAARENAALVVDLVSYDMWLYHLGDDVKKTWHAGPAAACEVHGTERVGPHEPSRGQAGVSEASREACCS